MVVRVVWVVWACSSAPEVEPTPGPAARSAAERVGERSPAPLPVGATARWGGQGFGTPWPLDPPERGAVGGAVRAGVRVGSVGGPRGAARAVRSRPPPRVHPLEGGRWATWTSAGWTLWDPATGWVAWVSGKGTPTPDGAWVVSSQGAVRLDPRTVPAQRRHGGLTWSDAFAQRSADPEPDLTPGCLSADAQWWSHDGARGACSTSEGLRVFDARGVRVALWPSAERRFDPGAVAFRPGSDDIVLSGRAGGVKWWRPATDTHGDLIGDRLSNRTMGVGFTLDGSLLVAVDSSSRMALFDADDWQRVDPVTEGHGPIRSMGFTPDGVLVAGDDRQLYRFDAGLSLVAAPARVGTASELTLEGTHACVGRGRGRRCRDAAGAPVDPVPQPEWRFEVDGSNRPWLVDPSGVRYRLTEPGRSRSQSPRVSWSARRRFAVVEGAWVVEPAARRVRPVPARGAHHEMAIADEGDVYVASGRSVVRYGPGGRVLGRLEAPLPIRALAAYDHVVVTSHPDGSIVRWDPAALGARAVPGSEAALAPPSGWSVDLRPDLPAPAPEPGAPRLEPAGDGYVIVTGHARAIVIGVPRAELTAIAPGSSRIALARDGQVWIRDPEGEVRTVDTGLVWDLAISPDGRWIAVDGRRGLQLVDADEATVELVLAGARIRASEHALSFSADSAVLRFGAHWAWEVPSGAVSPRPHIGRISTLALSNDGRWLAAGGTGGVVIVDTRQPDRVRHYGDIDRPHQLAFQDATTLRVATRSGSALVSADGSIHRTDGAWPFQDAGLRIDDEGRVDLQAGELWWRVDPATQRVTGAEAATWQPSWAGVDDLWFSGPGVSAAAPPSDAPCGLTTSMSCTTAAPRTGLRPGDLEGLRGPLLMSATRSGVMGHTPRGLVIRRAMRFDVRLGDGWDNAGWFAWSGPDRLLGIGPAGAGEWPGGLLGSAWSRSPFPGQTLALAASGDRVVRTIDGSARVLVVEERGGDEPSCVLARPASTSGRRLVVSPSGRWAAWGQVAVADLDACTLVAAPQPLPAETEVRARFPRAQTWLDGHTVQGPRGPRALQVPRELQTRLASAGVARRRARYADPTGRFAVMGAVRFDLTGEHAVAGFPRLRDSAVVNRNGVLAWIAGAGTLHVQRGDRAYRLPKTGWTAAAFGPTGDLIAATEHGRVHLWSVDDAVAQGTETEPLVALEGP